MARGADKLAAAMRDEDYAEEDSEEGNPSAYADLFREIKDAIQSGDDDAGATALEEFIHKCVESGDDDAGATALEEFIHKCVESGGDMPKGKGHGIAIVLGGKG